MSNSQNSLVKFFIELIKHQTKKHFGDDSFTLIVESITDFTGENVSGKLSSFFDQGEQAQQLLNAFETADKCFAIECNDELLRQAIISKPLAAIPSLEKIAGSLPKTLDDNLIRESLRKQFAIDWPKFTESQLSNATTIYLTCLDRSLSLERDQLFSAIIRKLERIDKRDERIETIITKIVSMKEKQEIQTENSINSSLNNIRRKHLENSIQETLALINEYEEILRLANDPKEKKRNKKNLLELQEQLYSYQKQLNQITTP